MCVRVFMCMHVQDAAHCCDGCASWLPESVLLELGSRVPSDLRTNPLHLVLPCHSVAGAAMANKFAVGASIVLDLLLSGEIIRKASRA